MQQKMFSHLAHQAGESAEECLTTIKQISDIDRSELRGNFGSYTMLAFYDIADELEAAFLLDRNCHSRFLIGK